MKGIDLRCCEAQKSSRPVRWERVVLGLESVSLLLGIFV